MNIFTILFTLTNPGAGMIRVRKLQQSDWFPNYCALSLNMHNSWRFYSTEVFKNIKIVCFKRTCCEPDKLRKGQDICIKLKNVWCWVLRTWVNFAPSKNYSGQAQDIYHFDVKKQDLGYCNFCFQENLWLTDHKGRTWFLWLQRVV